MHAGTCFHRRSRVGLAERESGDGGVGSFVGSFVVSGPEEALVVLQENLPDARARRVVDVLADGVEIAATCLVVAELGHEVCFVILRRIVVVSGRRERPAAALPTPRCEDVSPLHVGDVRRVLFVLP